MTEAPRIRNPHEGVYGRKHGHAPSAARRAVMDRLVPAITFAAGAAPHPAGAFGTPVEQVWLEVGFGGGEHALAQLQAHPGIGLIGCEVFQEGVATLIGRLDRLDDAALTGRFRLWGEDARMLLRALPDACLDRMFLLFPDPWPKNRHAKRRFVQTAILPVVARVLRPGGDWRIATDDPVYQAWIMEVLAVQDLFDGATPLPERPADWPETRYEQKALAAGRSPMWWRLVKR